MKQITLDECSIIIKPTDEDRHPSDDLEVQEQIDYVLRKYDEIGTWAWCVVEVQVWYQDLHESVYLGGCSYEDEEDFRNNSGYFEDMCDEALEELNKTVADLQRPE